MKKCAADFTWFTSKILLDTPKIPIDYTIFHSSSVFVGRGEHFHKPEMLKFLPFCLQPKPVLPRP